MATCPICRQDYGGVAFCPRDGSRLLGEQVLDGRYRLLRKVGEGAMGEVFEAEHVTLRRRVAVKILRRHIAYQPEAIARLEREAQATSQLGHPNIVTVLDFGQTEDGSVYLAMEWLDGEDLEEHLARGPIDIATALDIITQAASGVAEAHDHGVIHRDLKPANLFIARDRSGAMRVKVLDFGIAKLAVEQTQLTGTGVLIGTPNYMAPEQALGDPVDARTDVYALGVILYELLTGTLPFRGDSPIAVLHQHTSRMPAAPSAVAEGRGIDSDLDLVVMRCLAKRPAERFGSMHDLVAAIGAARTGARQTPPPPVFAETDDDLIAAAGIRRRSGVAILAGIFAVCGVAALVVFLVSRRVATESSAPADGATPISIVMDARSPAGTQDAGTAPADAGTIAAAVDAGGEVDGPAAVGPAAWTHVIHGHGFHLHASVGPDAPSTSASFELSFELEDLNGEIRDALGRDALRMEVSAAYYRDHALVHRSSHRVDASGHVRVPMTLSQVGKHHVTVDLLEGTARVGRGKFDLPVRR